MENTMSKNNKNKKRKSLSDSLTLAAMNAKESLSSADKDTKRKAKDLLIFRGITVIAMAVYIYFVQMWEFKAVFIIYLSVWTVSVLAYCFYNRGFLGSDVTEEMLSPHWSDEKKKQFLNSIKERKRKSRWLIFIIAPLTFVFIMELFIVYLWPEIYSAFKSFGK